MVPPPLIKEKFEEKTAKAINMIFCKWTTFRTIFETISAKGACDVTIIGGVVYKKSKIF